MNGTISLFSLVAMFLATSIGKADEADDLVEKLAKKHGYLAEREGLDRTKPIWRFGIQTSVTNKDINDVQTIFKELPNLKGLKQLYLNNGKLKDAGLKAVGECKKLEHSTWGNPHHG